MRHPISQYALQVCIARIEERALLKGIRALMRAQMVQRQRLVAGFDVDLQIPPCAPPQRLEGVLLAAIGQNNVVKADRVPARDVVAVALL